jgi:hypothetical protein
MVTLYMGVTNEIATPQASFSRHRRRCTVCHHPRRKRIEQEFLRWRNPAELAREFGIPHCSAIYRHAHAFRLFERRRLNFDCLSEQIRECEQSANPTADAVLQAVRLLAQTTLGGQWIDSPRRVIVNNIVQTDAPRRSRKRTPARDRVEQLDFVPPEARPRPKANAAARTTMSLAQQVTAAQQLIADAHRRVRNLAKQLKRNGATALTANHKIAVPESYLAENAALENS